jgi:hypothetical protein
MPSRSRTTRADARSLRGVRLVLSPSRGRAASRPLAKTLVLVTQNMGRTGPIDLAQGEISWAALLGISLLWVVISAYVVIVSVRSGMRRLAWGWSASFLVGLLVAAYSFWSM